MPLTTYTMVVVWSVLSWSFQLRRSTWNKMRKHCIIGLQHSCITAVHASTTLSIHIDESTALPIKRLLRKKHWNSLWSVDSYILQYTALDFALMHRRKMIALHIVLSPGLVEENDIYFNRIKDYDSEWTSLLRPFQITLLFLGPDRPTVSMESHQNTRNLNFLNNYNERPINTIIYALNHVESMGTGSDSRTAIVKNSIDLFVAKMGVVIRMVACKTKVSMVEKGAVWNHTDTSGPVLKAT